MFKNKKLKKVLKYLFISTCIICFPWAVTLALGGGSKEHIYKASESGMYVNIENEKLDVEEFVACVLMKQMNIDDEEEALKAQAVIIRTYVYEKMNESGVKLIDAKELDLEYIYFDEMEKLWGDDFPGKYNKLMKIVDNTSMEILLFEDKIIKPYFHNTSCGSTRNGKEVFGESYGYLLSVESKSDVESHNYLTGFVFTMEEFTKIVREAKPEVAISEEKPIETLQIVSRDTAGYVNELHIGNVVMTGDEFAYIFELNSPNFQVEEFDGQIRIVTKGLGHGLGLSMYGAMKLAKEGKSYVEILKHYYTGVYLSS